VDEKTPSFLGEAPLFSLNRSENLFFSFPVVLPFFGRKRQFFFFAAKAKPALTSGAASPELKGGPLFPFAPCNAPPRVASPPAPPAPEEQEFLPLFRPEPKPAPFARSFPLGHTYIGTFFQKRSNPVSGADCSSSYSEGKRARRFS